MWLVTVLGLDEPGLPILVNGKLYEIVSYRHYDE